ncbi:SpoVA/SpoVAEb family sporulation membrane protein, partial [Clostridium perfringens]
MSGSNQKPKSDITTMSSGEYQAIAKKHEPPRPILKNCLRAFLVGGLICLIGQCIQKFFMSVFD